MNLNKLTTIKGIKERKRTEKELKKRGEVLL